ncbi:O-antigen ligase family protein [Desulfogranum japonicum]|uniref:O-antigen ligase family protein n=1 Tax=Desulfogranum japonicum TaxID=231447 RepID=UPI00041491C8|nr:O-antigen ligase family protein [Desulfogranum japonicum]
MDNRINTVLVFLVVFAPLAFGSIDIWSNMVIEVVAFSALLVWLIHRYRTEELLERVPGMLPLCLYLGWVAVQLVPLPMGVLSLVSPKAAEIYSQAAMNTSESLRNFAPITLAPRETLQELLRFSAYAAIYVSVIQCIRTRAQMRKLTASIVVVVSTVCIIGILQHYSGTTRVWWIREFSVQNFFGTFAYKNHFGAMVCLVTPLILAHYLYYRSRVNGAKGPIVKRCMYFLEARSTRRQLLYAVAIVLVVLGLGLSESRGGVCCAGLSVFLFLGFNRQQIKFSALAFIGCLIALVLLTGVGKDALQTVDYRLGKAIDYDLVTVTGRTGFWKNSKAIIRDFAITGTGAGTYYSAYPLYETTTSGILPQHAHDEYIESLVTNGVVGSVCIAWFVVAVLVATYGHFKSRRERYVRYLYSAVLAGLLSFLVHCIVELDFHVSSSVGLYFCIMLALLSASVKISQRNAKPRVGVAAIAVPRSLYLATCAALPLLLFCTLAFHGGELYAGLQFPANSTYGAALAKVGYEAREKLERGQQVLPRKERSVRELVELSSRARKAACWAPFNALYPFLNAQIQIQLHEHQEAIHQIAAAQQLQPASARYFQAASQILAEVYEIGPALENGKIALQLDPQNYAYASWYASLLLQSVKEKEALAYLSEMLALFPGKAFKTLNLYSEQGISSIGLARYVPDSITCQLALAKLYEQEGKVASAARVYRHIPNLFGQAERLEKRYFWQQYSFFMRRNQSGAALEVLRTATRYFPDDFEIRVKCAELYKEHGLMNYAREQYLSALALRPGDKDLRELALAIEVK